MQNAFRFLLGLALAATAFAQRDIGTVEVQGDPNKTTAVSVSSSSPELQNLALLAFGAHGAYRVVPGGSGAFAISFAPAGANQVTVTVTKTRGVVVESTAGGRTTQAAGAAAGATVLSQTVSGTSQRNALLKAADLAVTSTTGLRGIFAGKLAFVAEHGGQQTVMTGDLFGGEIQSHPVQGKQIVGPRWAPDGSKIIFTSYKTGFPDIYVLDLRARQLNVFASFKGTNSGGRFSPDGSRVAMVLSGEGNPEIYIGNSTGRQIKRLTNSQSVEASPCWSPDGGRLVFTSDVAGGPQLFVMSTSGGTMSRVGTNISKYCAEPDWCPTDAKKIIFTAGVGRGYQSALYDFSAGASKIVTKAPMDAIEPVWTADGRHIVCTFRTATSKGLYLVDTESGKSVRISPSALGNAGNASYLAQ